METTVKSKQRPILVKIADQLLKDQQELDLLAVQISLGKAEVKDRFEEAKKQMKKSIREFKEVLSFDKNSNKDWANSIRIKLNELEGQLAKGKVESKKVFDEQKQIILKEIEELRNEIKMNPDAVKLAHYFTAATEKIKLQMDLFEKNMGAKKTGLTEEFKDEMNHAREKINTLLAKANKKKDDMDLKLENFNDEIHLSYEHLKKAFKAL